MIGIIYDNMILPAASRFSGQRQSFQSGGAFLCKMSSTAVTASSLSTMISLNRTGNRSYRAFFSHHAQRGGYDV
jgi:hypothetical protein